MATRLDVLNIWLREVPRNRQAQTIITLYNASNNAGKDAIFNAFKTDVLAIGNEKAGAIGDQEDAITERIAEVEAVT